ncbi:MAG: nucleotidyltransferase domain-containing protein [Deltaproteobacteria bacterium]|nr:nucleotidyltransferase domain-containing protein [Deltaproteobacteria bacterium]
MAKSKVREAVSFFQKCLDETGLHVSKLILFGSQARGSAKGDSDIDLMIVADDFRAKDIFQRAQLTKDAEIKTIKKFLIPLDIVTLTPEEFESETSLAATYAKSGKVLQAA